MRKPAEFPQLSGVDDVAGMYILICFEAEILNMSFESGHALDQTTRFEVVQDIG